MKYLLKFICIFSFLYFGTILFIGVTAPVGYYWAFADKYINYVAGLRYLLLHSSKLVLQIFGYQTYLKDIYTLRMVNGFGVHVGFDCIGYGVIFFWVAFITANTISFKKKLTWLIGGVLLIWLINVVRICLMVVSINKNWKTPLNLDNHTLFNIAAYVAIFSMIYFFDQSTKNQTVIVK